MAFLLGWHAQGGRGGRGRAGPHGGSLCEGDGMLRHRLLHLDGQGGAGQAAGRGRVHREHGRCSHGCRRGGPED
eukprot:533301-Pyramimonas_sp.AAC.1